MRTLKTLKIRASDENRNPHLIDSHLQSLINNEPRKASESLSTDTPPSEKSPLCSSLKRKRPPTIQIPAVLREIKLDPNLKSPKDGNFICFGDVGFGVSSVKGKKKFMEDAHKVVSCFDGNPAKGFFGVYDGHGGRKAAEFVAENLHTNMLEMLGNCTENLNKIEAVKTGYLKTDKEFLELEVGSGACCVTALIQGNEMIISNLGDCRAVLCRGGVAEALTEDHTAEQADERKRIEDNGGYVEIHRGGWRVHGVLSVSRSIGDSHLKSWVVAEPETKVLSLTPDMEFVILASDGLWGKVGNQEAIDVVLRSRSALKGKNLGPAEELSKENSDEFVCINSSCSPKRKRITVVKQRKMTSMSPSPQNKKAGNFKEGMYELDTENVSPPSKMRRTSLLQQSIKTQPPSDDDNKLSISCKELVNLAVTRGTLDDITVMVIDLNHFRCAVS